MSGSPERPITGALAAAVTPLRDDGARIDEEAFGPLLALYASGGVDGLFVLGTTGEGILLDQPERRRVAELTVEGADGLAVVVHCGAQSTAATCTLAAHAAEIGADAVAVMGPPYYALEAHELLEHFAAAARACEPLPFYVYEYADRSGYAVPVSVIEDLRDRAPNLVGMKVSDTPFERVETYLATGLDVFVGPEALVRRGLEHGAAGAVSGTAAVFPEAVSSLVHSPSQEREALVTSLRAALSRGSFRASAKAALAFRGLPVRPDVRAPLRPLGPKAAARLQSELQDLLGAASLAG